MKPGSKQNEFKVFLEKRKGKTVARRRRENGSYSLEYDQNSWYWNREDGRVTLPAE
jgi:hypothetical protein